MNAQRQQPAAAIDTSFLDEYPEVMTVRDLRKALNLSRTVAYDLAQSSELETFRVVTPRASVLSMVRITKKSVRRMVIKNANRGAR